MTCLLVQYIRYICRLLILTATYAVYDDVMDYRKLPSIVIGLVVWFTILITKQLVLF